MLLMMFYTTVAGWMLAYIPKMATGTFDGASTEVAGSVFNALLANPSELIGWMIAAIAIGFAVCSLGLQKGVERITKWLMAILFVVMIILCIRTTTLPGGAEGIAFYLIPDFSRMFEGGMATFGEAVYAAMGQAFFSLSLGIAAMEIFGSYINKDRRLMSEAVFGNRPQHGSGHSCRTHHLPRMLRLRRNARFRSFTGIRNAALGIRPNASWQPLGCTVLRLHELCRTFYGYCGVRNLISFSMDKWEISRRRAVAINGILVLVLSLPCALGFNVLSDVTIPAIGDIQSIEDFIVSNNMLPLGALVFVLFCTRRYGWGWDNFLKEADTGIGIKFPAWSRIWVSYGIPVLIIIIFIMGYAPKIAFWLGLS